MASWQAGGQNRFRSVYLFGGKTVFPSEKHPSPIFPGLQKTDALRDFFRLGPAAEGLSAHLFGEAQGEIQQNRFWRVETWYFFFRLKAEAKSMSFTDLKTG